MMFTYIFTKETRQIYECGQLQSASGERQQTGLLTH